MLSIHYAREKKSFGMYLSDEFLFCFCLFVEDEGPGRVVSFSASVESMSVKICHIRCSLKTYLCLEAHNVLGLLPLPVVVSPTSCCLVSHCKFLLSWSFFLSVVQIPSFLPLHSDHLIEVSSWGTFHVRGFLIFITTKNGLSPYLPCQAISPLTNNKIWQGKENVLACCSQALRLQWSYINWFDVFILTPSCPLYQYLLWRCNCVQGQDLPIRFAFGYCN